MADRRDSELDRIARALGGAKRTTNGWDAQCPCHDDRTASLSLSYGKDGQLLAYCHAGCTWEDIKDEFRRRGLLPEAGDAKSGARGAPPAGRSRIIATYDYLDEQGELVFQVCRFEPKEFRQRRRAQLDDDPAKVRDGWVWSVSGVRIIPYRLPEVLEAVAGERTVFVVEGEKDADNLAKLGVTATCNAAGAGKWRKDHAKLLRGADIVILPDNDDAGRDHADKVARSLKGIAARVRVLDLPGLPAKGDVSDWLRDGHDAAELWRLVDTAPDWSEAFDQSSREVSLSDFVAYLPANKFLYRPTGDLWPAESVDNTLEAPGRGRRPKASRWLAENAAVHQMTWAPGEPEIIEGRHLVEGGWVEKAGARTYNTYRPCRQLAGDPDQAGPWLEHLQFCYPADSEHILNWMAQRVQQPHIKINHALVLGSDQGIGKDSLLAPVRIAVGEWNFAEINPSALMGRFTPFTRAVILRMNEAHDLGDMNRFQLYERSKTFIAAPPEVLTCELKGRNTFSVPNVLGMLITTNHKTAGIFLPPDDRRHYVAWSDATRADFNEEYFRRLWAWYEAGGYGHISAYLRTRDISGFDPKVPPPQTDAWWEIVGASTPPERNDIGDIIKELPHRDALTVGDIIVAARISNPSLESWLQDRSSRRLIPIRMEEAGYVAARNPNQSDGRWKINKKNTVVFAAKNLPAAARIEAARRLVEQKNGSAGP